jgi:hypothetical protein
MIPCGNRSTAQFFVTIFWAAWENKAHCMVHVFYLRRGYLFPRNVVLLTMLRIFSTLQFMFKYIFRCPVFPPNLENMFPTIFHWP